METHREKAVKKKFLVASTISPNDFVKKIFLGEKKIFLFPFTNMYVWLLFYNL